MTAADTLLVAAATAAGAGVGGAAGWLSVFLERIEGLEAEEAEERRVYEADVAAARDQAEASGETPDTAPPWLPERYGWTWLERILGPILGAITFGAFAAHQGWGIRLLIHLVWIAIFVHIVTFDLKHRLILNRVSYPSVLLALVLAPVTPDIGLLRALAGAGVIGLFFAVQWVVSRGAIGLGDAKLGALLGAITGLGLDADHLGAIYAVIYAVFLGGGVALLLLAARVRGLKDPIPYGPFLCAGAALVLYQAT